MPKKIRAMDRCQFCGCLLRKENVYKIRGKVVCFTCYYKYERGYVI